MVLQTNLLPKHLAQYSRNTHEVFVLLTFEILGQFLLAGAMADKKVNQSSKSLMEAAAYTSSSTGC